ncbi:MAG: DUF4157 domain-containing protein [Pseudomonadota bacterium]
MRAAPQAVRTADAAPAMRGRQRDDALEHEADKAADSVVRDRFPDRKPEISTSRGDARQIPAAVRQVVSQPGEALARAERSYFEPRFGQDLSGIRIHSDMLAQRSAAMIDAQAYAYRNHIVFGEGAPAGRRLLAHELAHTLQQRIGAPAIQRKPKTDAQEENKPAIISVTAEQGGKTADVVLSDGTSATVELLVNKMTPGDYTTSPTARVPNATSQGIPGKFIYRYPLDPYTEEPLNGLAPKIEIHIRPSPTGQLRELPKEIQDFVTSDRATAGTADEYRDAAFAGEILKGAGVTADELILVQESRRHDREMGITQSAGTQTEWAFDYVEKRNRKQLDTASNWDSLVELSKIMAEAPIHLLHRGGVGSILKDGSDKLALVNYINLLKFNRISPASKQDLEATGARLLSEFRALIGHFENALVADLTNLAVTALDGAEASLLRMDRQYVGLWQDKKWSPNYFWAELQRINRNEKVAAASRQRAAVKQKLDSEQQADSINRALNPFSVIGDTLSGEPTYSQRTEQREKQMEQQEQAFNQTVAEESNLKVTQGFSAQDILSAKDASTAQGKLTDFLFDGRRQITRARDLIKDRKVIYAADKVIDMEKERLKGAIGGKSSEIGRVIDDLASYRKSQTSIWDDILKVVEFVSMFVPGPIGWGLRLGVAAVNFDKKMTDIGTRRALYGGDLSAKSVGSGEVGDALFEAAIQVVPDVPQVAKAERLTLNLEKGAVRSADDVAGAASRTAATAEHGAPQKLADDVAGGGSKLPESPGGAGTHGSPPTKPDLGVPTYNNLPRRVPKGGERVQIVERDGLFFEVDYESGALIPATGDYAFARMPDGSLWGSRYGHAEASMGGPVAYAGNMKMENGALKTWNRESGTYKPVGDHFADQAGFPIPPQPLPQQPGKQVQLPVFQERTKPRTPAVDPDAAKPDWTDFLPDARKRTEASKAAHKGDLLAMGKTTGGLPPDVETALGKLGMSEDELGKFARGEKAAGVIKRGDIEFKHYLVNEGDTLVAGVLSSYAYGDRASMIKAYLTFRQTSMAMAKSMGAKTLRLEADVVMSAELAEDLMRRGYRLVDEYSSKYALEIPVR